jgi:hypothetical protein
LHRLLRQEEIAESEWVDLFLTIRRWRRLYQQLLKLQRDEVRKAMVVGSALQMLLLIEEEEEEEEEESHHHERGV